MSDIRNEIRSQLSDLHRTLIHIKDAVELHLFDKISVMAHHYERANIFL